MTSSPFDIEPDQVTLARARRGDLAACETLYRLFQQPAYSTAYRICQCPQLAQDVCQEAFINAFGRLRQFRGESPFWGWLRRVVVNHAISTLRRQPRYQTASLEDVHLNEAAAEPRLDLSMDLSEALARLDADDRAVVWLHDVEGFNHREIAGLFDMTESFSKTRLSRARARLREWLDPGPIPGPIPGLVPAPAPEDSSPTRPPAGEPSWPPPEESKQWMNPNYCPTGPAK